jgi:carboxyl-terminal processing protease
MKLKSVREMLKRLCLALFIVSALACQADPRVNIVVSESDLKPELQQSVIAKSLVELLENFHYQKVVVDDTFSSIVFDEYLKALDNGKSYFLQTDIDDFEKYRLTMDDDIRSGDLSVPFYILKIGRAHV